MKRNLVLAFLLCITHAAFGQGTVFFYNHVPTVGLDAPVFDVDGLSLLSGPQYNAQLFAGPSADTLRFVPGPALFAGEPGYWMSWGDSLDRSIPDVPPGSVAFLQVRVWSADGKHGESLVFQAVTGGDTQNGTQPPTFPAYLAGLESFTLTPEPSTIALFIAAGVVGLGSRVFKSSNKRGKQRDSLFT
jgi:hypothetical protein